MQVYVELSLFAFHKNVKDEYLVKGLSAQKCFFWFCFGYTVSLSWSMILPFAIIKPWRRPPFQARLF